VGCIRAAVGYSMVHMCAGCMKRSDMLEPRYEEMELRVSKRGFIVSWFTHVDVLHLVNIILEFECVTSK
jgi:hypothetical protein